MGEDGVKRLLTSSRLLESSGWRGSVYLKGLHNYHNMYYARGVRVIG